MPDVPDIVIVNYNTCELLRACLTSIAAHAPEAALIVVDNASADGSADLVRSAFPNCRLIVQPRNSGFACAANAGVRAARTPAVLLLNADTELLPDTLPPLLRAAAAHPRAGVLGPAHVRPDGTAAPSAFPLPTLGREIARQLFWDTLQARLGRGPWRAARGGPRAAGSLIGAALLLRADCFAALAGFDEAAFMYGEDWDLCLRAQKAGWEVLFVPEARIVHHDNASAAQVYGSRRAAVVTRANLYFHRKHFGRVSAAALRPVTAAGACLRLLLLAPALPLWPFAPWVGAKLSEMVWTLLAALDLAGRR